MGAWINFARSASLCSLEGHSLNATLDGFRRSFHHARFKPQVRPGTHAATAMSDT